MDSGFAPDGAPRNDESYWTHRTVSSRASLMFFPISGLMLLAATADGGSFNSATVVAPSVTTSNDIEVAASSSPETMTARKMRSIP